MKVTTRAVSPFYFGLVLFLSSGAMESLTFQSRGGDAAGSPLMKILWALAYLIAFLGMVPHYREILTMLKANAAMTALLGLSLLSILWSIDQSATLARSVPLILSSLIGLEFARRHTTQEQLRIIWVVLATLMILGVIAQVFFPGFVPNAGDDEIAATAWHGIVPNKNTWARLVVVTGLVILARTGPTALGRIKTTVLTVFVFALIVASRSTGGLTVMVELTALFLILPILRWKNRKALVLVLWTSFAAFVSAAALVVVNFTRLMVALGKDPTMTGRLPLWAVCLQFAGQRPLLGYGFGAFWTEHSRPGRLVREALNWDTLPHPHNGYVELLLALGAIGLTLYLAANVVALRRAARYVRHTHSAEALWPICFICCTFLYQVTESSIIASNQLIWILYSATLFSLGLMETRSEAVAEPLSLVTLPSRSLYEPRGV